MLTLLPLNLSGVFTGLTLAAFTRLAFAFVLRPLSLPASGPLIAFTLDPRQRRPRARRKPANGGRPVTVLIYTGWGAKGGKGGKRADLRRRRGGKGAAKRGGKSATLDAP